MTKELFKFPIILIDGSVEDKKMKDSEMLGLPLDDSEPDIIYAEAECPYYDFLSVSDRWLPTEESFQNAKKGIFDACNVIFLNSGGFIVPMSKEEFRESLESFIEGFEIENTKPSKKKSKNEAEVKILKVSQKDVLEMLRKKLEEEDNEGDQFEKE
jgi:hypothetical protein